MKRTVLLTSAFFGVVCLASAFDSDPGYGPDRPWQGEGRHFEGGRWYGGRGGDEPNGAEGRMLVPKYYRPTQRYYGNGYTVSYRYIPVFQTDFVHGGSVGESSNFPTGSSHISTSEYQSFGNNLARITQKDEKSSSRTAVTSIVRKKSTTGRASKKGASDAAPTEMPAITPSTPSTSAPASAPTPSTAPDAAAPSSSPAPAGAPAKP